MQQSEVDGIIVPADDEWRFGVDRLYLAVQRCRDLGGTWTQIGNALGVTPQAVQQKYRAGAPRRATLAHEHRHGVH